MKDLGFFASFFGVLIFLAVITSSGKTFFELSTGTTATSTASSTLATAPQPTDSGSTTETPPKEPRKLNPIELEEKIAYLYQMLDELREDLRQALLEEPASPYRGMVELRIGGARETDPAYEFISIQASRANPDGVDISKWYLESYVTENQYEIPKGDRLLESWRANESDNITLLPGELAFILSGRSPIGGSFHENACTGYLTQHRKIYPSLGINCPAPLTEMKRDSSIEPDNDTCYDFVEKIPRCIEPDEDLVADADLTRTCERFIAENLNYTDCVKNHKNEPLFDNVGYWNVFLDYGSELWRSEREIIRLMDENDMVVDVIEY